MKKQKIKLMSSQKKPVMVEVDEVHVVQTYSQLLAGNPALPVIKHNLVFGNYQHDILSSFPQFIMGNFDITDDKILPSHTVFIYLVSNNPIKNKTADGSHLVVKILMDFDFSVDILSQVKKYLDEVEWDVKAKDFFL